MKIKFVQQGGGNLWFEVLRFFGSAIAIVVAGSFLTRFADQIAEHTGWGRMFVGSLLLAGATSLPELMVDLKAVELGLPDLAVGDLLGSSLFNLLILALLDFAFPSAFRGTAFSPKFLHHSLAAVLTIVLTSIVGIGIVSQFGLSFFGVSIFSWTVALVYLYGLRWIFLDGAVHIVTQSRAEDREGSFSRKWRPLTLAFLGYVGCATAILLVAPFLVKAADELAKLSGIGHTFIGTTLVAFATSLPEMVATIAAFRMGAPDLALGNIFGSNAFNMVLFFPLDMAYPGSLFDSVSRVHAVSAFGVVTATGVAVMGQLYRKTKRSRFTEPSSEIVVAVILLFLFLLFHLS